MDLEIGLLCIGLMAIILLIFMQSPNVEVYRVDSNDNLIHYVVIERRLIFPDKCLVFL